MENKKIDQIMNWRSVDTELPKADLDQPRFSVDVLLTDCQSFIVSYFEGFWQKHFGVFGGFWQKHLRNPNQKTIFAPKIRQYLINYDFKLKEWHNYQDLEHDPSHWMYINMPQQ